MSIEHFHFPPNSPSPARLYRSRDHQCVALVYLTEEAEGCKKRTPASLRWARMLRLAPEMLAMLQEIVDVPVEPELVEARRQRACNLIAAIENGAGI